MQDVMPLILPEISREAQQAAALFASLPNQLTLPLTQGEVTLSFSRTHTGFKPQLQLPLSLGEHTCTLICDAALAHILVNNWLPGEALNFLPEPLRYATLEAAIAPAQAWFEQYERGVSLAGAPQIEKCEPKGQCLYIDIQYQQDKGTLCLPLTQHTLDLLAPWTRTKAPEAHIDWRSLPHTASVVLAHTQLPGQQLQQLQPGALIFFDTSYFRPDHPGIKLKIAEHLSFDATWQQGQLVINNQDSNQGETMTHSDGIINDIPVQLSFEAGSLQISLGELSQLTEGHVFSFDADANQAIALKANGQKIGLCTLVSVDGKLGAQITSLNQASTALHQPADVATSTPIANTNDASSQPNEAPTNTDLEDVVEDDIEEDFEDEFEDEDEDAVEEA